MGLFHSTTTTMSNPDWTKIIIYSAAISPFLLGLSDIAIAFTSGENIFYKRGAWGIGLGLLILLLVVSVDGGFLANFLTYLEATK